MRRTIFLLASCGALLGLAAGSITTFVPRYWLWGFDVTWILGSAELAVYGAILGTIVGVAWTVVCRVSSALVYRVSSRRRKDHI